MHEPEDADAEDADDDDEACSRRRRHGVPGRAAQNNHRTSSVRSISQANPYLGNQEAVGNCSKALQGNPNARIVLIKDAPHTLMNEPEAREAEDKFLKDVLLK